MLSTQVAWSQIIGDRQYQQDHAAIITWPNGFTLLMLADGMGGHVGGDIASHLVIDEFKQSFANSTVKDMRKRLIEALKKANIAILDKVMQEPELQGMGTTLIALIFDGTFIQWLSVGDSPMWLARNDALTRLNDNHSMSVVLAQQVARGEISKEEADTSPLRSQLLEAIMGEDIEHIDAPESTIKLQHGDTLILASDGVETCSPQKVLELALNKDKDATTLATAILEAVDIVQRPKQDNATVVIMRVAQQNRQESMLVPLNGVVPVEEPSTTPQH